MNDRIRRKGTRCLTEAAAKIGAKAYIQQSIVWVANPKDGSPFDEDSPVVSDSLVQSAVDTEAIAREAGTSEGFTTVILRGGAFYDCDSAHTRMLAEGLRKRAMPIIGRGDAVWSVIHTDDAASAYVAAAEHPRDGAWHIVDDEPVSVRALLETIAHRLGAPRPRRVPIWLAKLLAGERAVAYFTRSTRTSNARFRRDYGWAPRYPTYREGLDQVIAAWNAQTGKKNLA
jgi:nucleoside-diphosphate-sugar epimerase